MRGEAARKIRSRPSPALASAPRVAPVSTRRVPDCATDAPGPRCVRACAEGGLFGGVGPCWADEVRAVRAAAKRVAAAGGWSARASRGGGRPCGDAQPETRPEPSVARRRSRVRKAADGQEHRVARQSRPPPAAAARRGPGRRGDPGRAGPDHLLGQRRGALACTASAAWRNSAARCPSTGRASSCATATATACPPASTRWSACSRARPSTRWWSRWRRPARRSPAGRTASAPWS